jgi:hypothetical protein
VRNAAFTAFNAIVSAFAGIFSFRLAEPIVGRNWAVVIGLPVFVVTVAIMDRIEKHYSN